MERQQIILILDVELRELNPTSGLQDLPDELADLLDVHPAVSLDSVFLMDAKQEKSTAYIEAAARDFHQAAVDERGEVCQDSGCQQHPQPLFGRPLLRPLPGPGLN